MKAYVILVIAIFLCCFSPYRAQIDLLHVFQQSEKMAHISATTYRTNEDAPDPSYGRHVESNIKVAYRDEKDTLAGPKMEHFYLAHLTCTCGKPIDYYRKGSCCNIISKHAFIGNTAPLDLYEIRCRRCKKSIEIYLNMYDHDTALYAPLGFKLTTNK